jgi:hypothetical protein
MQNYSLITLGELLSSENETIKRNAVSILKVLQKEVHKDNGHGYCTVKGCKIVHQKQPLVNQ